MKLEDMSLATVQFSRIYDDWPNCHFYMNLTPWKANDGSDNYRVTCFSDGEDGDNSSQVVIVGEFKTYRELVDHLKNERARGVNIYPRMIMYAIGLWGAEIERLNKLREKI